MNCENALPLLYDLVDDELTSTDRVMLDAHLINCRACQNTLNSIQRLETIYHQEIMVEPANKLADQITEQLLNNQRFNPPVKVSNWSTRAIILRVGAVAAGLAAMLYLAISLPIAALVGERAKDLTVSLKPSLQFNNSELLRAFSGIKLNSAISTLIDSLLGHSSALINSLPINATLLLVLIALQLLISYRLISSNGSDRLAPGTDKK